jgi:hypothetical protein
MQETEDLLPDCAICLAPLTKEESSKCFCGHIFHFNCIQDWAKTTQSCPLCRSHVPYISRIQRLFLLALAANKSI